MKAAIAIKADVGTCEQRDPKGHYRRARAGEIPDFTGVSAPYEEPVTPELEVDTVSLTVDESLEILLDYVATHFAIEK